MKSTKFFKGILATFVLLTITACNDEQSATYKNEVCVADLKLYAVGETNCKDGQIFFFKPERWGNEQMPIEIATYFCDFNFPIVYNKGGVSCVYKRKYDMQKPIQENNASK